MVDTGAPKAVVDLGRQRAALAEEQAGEERGRRGGQRGLGGVDRAAPHALVPGGARRIERDELIGPRGRGHVDAVAREPRDVVEAAGIPKACRRLEARRNADALPDGQLIAGAFPVRGELESSAPSLAIDTLDVEQQPQPAGRRSRGDRELARDVGVQRQRQPRDVVGRERRWRRAQRAERDDGAEQRDRAEREPARDECHDDHDAREEPHRPRHCS